ncbi:hypothetical protein [Aquipseudomonas campi]
MANRLQKLALTKYTPGVPYQPAVPARCVQVARQLPARTVVVRYTAVTQNGVTYYIPIFEQQPAETIYERVCYPAIPERQAVPAQTQYTAINGWNSGASSQDVLVGDGKFSFRVARGAIGVVAGVSRNDASTLPNEQTHAFYIHRGQVDVMESGVVVASSVLEHDADIVYRIIRSGDRITYEAGDWFYVSQAPSQGPVVLDVSLYSTGDFVDDPEMSAITASGYASGYLPAFTGIATEGGGYAFASGSLPAFTGSAAGGMIQGGGGALPVFTGWASDRANFAFVAGSMPAFTGVATGGFPDLQTASIQGTLAPFSGYAVGLTGEVASARGSLPVLSGWAADRPYAAISGSLQPFNGSGIGGEPNNAVGFIRSPLAIGSIFRPAEIAVAGYRSGLRIGSAFDLTVLAEDGIVSTLLIGSRFFSQYGIEAGYRSGLLLGGRFRGAEQDEGILGRLADQPLQLAVNVATGAPTLYLDCAFSGYARAGDDLYACREDGVYLIGAGDDEGLALQGLVDFGASDFGVSNIKRLDAAYFGLKTDGYTRMQLETDGGAYQYPVALRGPMARSEPGKGLAGRLWNITLEFEDASYFELDSMEVQVGASQRRLRGR